MVKTLSLPDYPTSLDPNGALHSLLMLQQVFKLVLDGKECARGLITGHIPLVAVLEALGLDAEIQDAKPLIKLWDEKYAILNNPEAFIPVAAQLINHLRTQARRAEILN